MKKIFCIMLLCVFFMKILSSKEAGNELFINQLKTDTLSFDTFVRSDTLKCLWGQGKIKSFNVSIFQKLPPKDSILEFVRWRMQNKTKVDSASIRLKTLPLKWQKRNLPSSKRWKIERPTHES